MATSGDLTWPPVGTFSWPWTLWGQISANFAPLAPAPSKSLTTTTLVAHAGLRGCANSRGDDEDRLIKASGPKTMQIGRSSQHARPAGQSCVGGPRQRCHRPTPVARGTSAAEAGTERKGHRTLDKLAVRPRADPNAVAPVDRHSALRMRVIARTMVCGWQILAHGERGPDIWWCDASALVEFRRSPSDHGHPGCTMAWVSFRATIRRASSTTAHSCVRCPSGRDLRAADPVPRAPTVVRTPGPRDPAVTACPSRRATHSSAEHGHDADATGRGHS